MNCEQAGELLGAFAVDALPDDEAAAFRAHLATCDEHAAKARELRTVASHLPAAVAPGTAPPALRARVLAAVALEPQDGLPAETIAAATLSERATDSVRPSPVRITWRPQNIMELPSRAWMGMAAALLILALGLVAWNVSLATRDEDPSELASAASSITELESSGGGRGFVLYFEDEEKAVVFGRDLADPGDDRTYQLWAIEDGTPRSLGLMEPDDDGTTTVAVDYDANEASALAITVEPDGGSERPTSAPLFTAEI